MAREPQISTSLAMDAWKLYKEEVAGRIAEGPWGGMISGFLMTMQDFIPEFFETLD